MREGEKQEIYKERGSRLTEKRKTVTTKTSRREKKE